MSQPKLVKQRYFIIITTLLLNQPIFVQKTSKSLIILFQNTFF